MYCNRVQPTAPTLSSTSATVRHPTRQTKGCGSRLATLTMVFKLAMQAERHWRKLNGAEPFTAARKMVVVPLVL